MLNIIIWLGLKYPIQFIKLLARLEYNNSIYLKKLANRALLENHFNLSDKLIKQSKEEERHGKILSCLVKSKLKIDQTGYWENENNKNLINNPISTKWGNFVQLDGVSHRYQATKWFFQNKSAFDYSWIDQLAFMTVLEKQTTEFYKLLSNLPDCPLSRIATKFTKEEYKHQSSLYYTLTSFTSIPDYYISIWQDRLNVAKFLLFVDILYFLYKNIKHTWKTKLYLL